ncbi:T9SS type A sorting domain-containing protein [Flammeovirgaceae bacterium SG7u.111]|nr:T9SS type A sorting domain-containing protein [Flammeovirgaceae bacterium SG7u.132]WPO38239.1 T9SS type A sorting domain-containing protein [Flammeovirgaceae bacterium SG7u.111]
MTPRITILLSLVLTFSQYLAFSQTKWLQSNDFPGTARSGAVFAEASGKGYYGTGSDGTNYLADWWEYDPLTLTWTQKANFPGESRQNALAFTLNDTVYVVTGQGDSLGTRVYHNDFYMYLPAENSWQQLSDFPGSGRSLAVSAVANGKAYIGTGRNSNDQLKDWWEYNPTNATWVQKANLTAEKRQSANAFSLDSLVFVGGGQNTDGGTMMTNDFYAYNPEDDSWEEKSFAENHLTSLNATAFVLGDTAYVFGGSTGLDLWKYHAGSNSWTEGESLVVGSEGNRTNSSALAFGSYALVVGGNYFNLSGFSDEKKADVWTYYINPPTKPNKPGYAEDNELYDLDYDFITFYWSDESDNELGYIIELLDYNSYDLISLDTIPADSTSFTTYNVSSDTKYTARIWAYNNIGDSDKKYYYPTTKKYLEEPRKLIAKSLQGNTAKLTWEDYSTREDGFVVEMSVNDTSTFTVVDSLPINTTSYLYEGLSEGNTYYFRVAAYIQDSLLSLYSLEYPGVTKKALGGWSEVFSFKENKWIDFRHSFSIEDKLYLTSKESDQLSVLMYDLTKGEFSEKSSFPKLLELANVFVIGKKAYFISGQVYENQKAFMSQEVYEYDSELDKWKRLNDFPSAGRISATAFAIKNKGYIVCGDTVVSTSGNVQTSDFWEYDPSMDKWTEKKPFVGGNREAMATIVIGDSVFVGLGQNYSGATIRNQWQYYKKYNDLYLYDQANDTWKQMADFPGNLSYYSVSGSNNSSGLFGGGEVTNNVRGDFWKYLPNTNKWVSIPYFTDDSYQPQTSFQTDSDFYVIAEGDWNSYSIFKFDPLQLSDVQTLSASTVLPDSVVLNWTGIDSRSEQLIVQEVLPDTVISIDTIGSDKNSYTLYNLEENSTHHYKLVQFNEDRTSSGSNTATAMIPGAPNLYKYEFNDTKKTARASFGIQNQEMSVKIEIANNYGPFVFIDSISNNSYFYDYSIPDSAEVTQARMVSSIQGNTYTSDTLELTKFKVPTDAMATWEKDKTEILVSWKNNSSLSEGYKVTLYRTNDIAFDTLLPKTINEVSFNLAQIGFELTETIEISLTSYYKNNSSYYYETVDELTRMLAPSNISFTNITQTETTVKWQDNSTQESGFKIIVKSAEGIVDTLATVPANTEQYTFDVSGYEEDIEISVVAFNEDENQTTDATEPITLEIDEGVVTSIKDELLANTVVYPNPANSIFKIEHGERDLPFIIKNSSAREVARGQTQNGKATVDVQTWPAGLYFIDLEGAVFKVIVQ